MITDDRYKIAYVSTNVPKDEAISVCSRLQQDLQVEFMRVENVQDIFPMLSNPHLQIDSIVIDVEDLSQNSDANLFDIVRTLYTLINCTVYRSTDSIKPKKRTTKIVVLVSDSVSKNLLKDILSIGEINHISLRWGGRVKYQLLKKCVENHISSTGERAPKWMLDFIKNQRPLKPKSSEITLTTRQRQIFDIISTRGVSNKYIAKMLNISESTVKLHVGSLLRKYGVKNRTQLAVFTKNKETQSSVYIN